MKRLALSIGAAGLLVVGASGIATASHGGGGGPHDSVTGAIKRTSLDGTLDQHHIVSAHQGPRGAHGQYQVTYGKGTDAVGYKGRVTCVNVAGNRAYVGIEITESTRPDAQVGDGEVIRVIDYGEPSDGEPRDALSPGPFSDTPPTECPDPVFDLTPTYAGNLTVHDGG